MQKSRAGFTLIELLIAITIITIIGAVGLGSYNRSVARTRDAKRVTELKAIQHAMELYYNDNDRYPREAAPDSANGLVGEGAGLDALLEPAYMVDVPHDPRGPGNADFRYYYDGNQACSGGPDTRIAVIFARTMEVVDGNADDICPGGWGGEGGAGSTEAWHIYIGPSDD